MEKRSSDGRGEGEMLERSRVEGCEVVRVQTVQRNEKRRQGGKRKVGR